MFWANGQFWNMFVTETSRAGPWTQLCSWRGCRLCLGMKKLFQSDHTLLDSAKLAVLVKTFPNRNSSRPTELSPQNPPAPLSTQVFAQCVTPPMSRTLASTLSLISFPSRVKINKLLDIPAILHPSRVLCVYSEHLIGIVLECNKMGKSNKKEKIRFFFYIIPKFPTKYFVLPFKRGNSEDCRLNKEVLSCLFRKTVGQDTQELLKTWMFFEKLWSFSTIHRECWMEKVRWSIMCCWCILSEEGSWM